MVFAIYVVEHLDWNTVFVVSNEFLHRSPQMNFKIRMNVNESIGLDETYPTIDDLAATFAWIRSYKGDSDPKYLLYSSGRWSDNKGSARYIAWWFELWKSEHCSALCPLPLKMDFPIKTCGSKGTMSFYKRQQTLRAQLSSSYKETQGRYLMFPFWLKHGNSTPIIRPSVKCEKTSCKILSNSTLNDWELSTTEKSKGFFDRKIWKCWEAWHPSSPRADCQRRTQ